MDWHVWVGLISGIVQVGATIPYVIDVVRGTTRPNIVSWSLWTLSVLITLAAQMVAGPSWSALLLVGCTVANLTVLLLALLGYGYKALGRVEKYSLAFSLLALILWGLTSNPLLAIAFALAADGIAYVPTYAKAYKDPSSEIALYWLALVLADLLALLSVSKFDAANAGFPIFYTLMNAGLWGLITLRSLKKA